MALGNNNITTSLVNTELSSPYTNDILVKNLCAHANAGNIASFLGPGTLAVDASKNVYWVAPVSDYKLGDFRGYNASATAPSASNNFTQNWGPGGSSVNMSLTSLPQSMNLFFIDSGATRIYYKAYLLSGTPGRAAETSLYDSQLSTVLTSAVTPLAGHTRTQTTKPQHPHIQVFSNFDTSGLDTPNDYVYMDTFFADTGGNRVVNFGNAIANGYTTITMHEYQNPQILSSGLGPTPFPAGYTTIYTVIASTSGSCLDDSPIAYGGSIGGTNITFYVGMHGIYSTTTRNVAATNFRIRITYDGSTKDVNTGTLSSSTKKYVSTTLPGGKTWAYDKDATITIVSCTYGSYITCP